MNDLLKYSKCYHGVHFGKSIVVLILVFWLADLISSSQELGCVTEFEL